MLRHVQIAGLLAIVFAAMIGIIRIATAEPPATPAEPLFSPAEPPYELAEPPYELAEPPYELAEPPYELAEPVLPLGELAAPGEARSPAEQKLRDSLEGDWPQGDTGDGILDDVIGIIKGRGSILDGSSLDPRASGGETNGPNVTSKNAYAAEQLLKASRLLESVGLDDKDRTDLVRRMRAEAEKLLSE